MDKYRFINFSDYEKLYYDQLYDACRQGGQIEGKKAVDFFKLSNLSPAILREIWNVASVYQKPFLSKEEFYIYMKFTALAQQGYSITIESLKSNHLKIECPKFAGIQMPPQPNSKYANPFDEFEDNQKDDEEFDDFQEAKSGPEKTTSASSNNIIPQSQSFQTHIIPSNIFQSKIQTQSLLITENLLELDMSVPIQPIKIQQQQKEETPKATNLDDLIFNSLKNVHKPTQQFQEQKKNQEEQKQQQQTDWASFNNTSKEIIPNKNRYDLINDAFEELLSNTQTQQTQPISVHQQQQIIQKPQEVNLLHTQEEDEFDDFVEASTPTQNNEEKVQTQNKQEHQVAIDDLLNLYQTSQQQIGGKTHQQINQENQNDEDDDFDEFVEAAPVSSIPDIEESRQDSNIFSNSKQDIENSFNNNSQDSDTKEQQKQQQPEIEMLGELTHQCNNQLSHKNVQELGFNNNFAQSFQNNEQNLQQEDDDQFGDWTTAENQVHTKDQNLNLDNAQQNELLLEEQDDSNKLELDESQQEVQAPPPKPRIELNENNLLSGFMQEFGLNLINSAQSKIQEHSLSNNSQPNVISSPSPRRTNKELFSIQTDNHSLEELKTRIQLHFGGANKPEAQNFDTLSDQEIDIVLNNKQKLLEFRQFLQTIVELSESDLQDTIDKQIQILDKIDKKNKKKAKAAENEEFELAVKYRNQVNQLKNQQLSIEKVRSLIHRKPVLSLHSLVERVFAIDPCLNFGKFIVNQVTLYNASKAKIALYTLIFMKQVDIGIFQLKKNVEEIMNNLTPEIKNIKSIFENLNEESSEFIQQLLEKPKFEKFIRGIGILQRILQINQLALQVAESQEDSQYSMDIEALLQETQTCLDDINSLISSQRNTNPQIYEILNEYKLDFEKVENLDVILSNIKDHSNKDSSFVNELTCQLCCNSFQVKGLSDSVQYNGQKYHSFCINFWLNKVANKS